MNVSKYVISSIAAVSVVGAIGLAYAQTTTTDTPANSTGPMTPPAAPTTSATPVEPATSPQMATPVESAPAANTPSAPQPDSTINSTVTPPTDGAMSNERPAQVDRN